MKEGQTQEPVGGMIPKPVKERNNLDLLELVVELHTRAIHFPSKEMHDAYWEARNEMESRLIPPPEDVKDYCDKHGITPISEEIFKNFNTDPYYTGRINGPSFDLGFKAGYASSQSSTSDAVEFINWINDHNYGCRLNPNGGYLWHEDDDPDATFTPNQLYSQFKKQPSLSESSTSEEEKAYSEGEVYELINKAIMASREKSFSTLVEWWDANK